MKNLTNTSKLLNVFIPLQIENTEEVKGGEETIVIEDLYIG